MNYLFMKYTLNNDLFLRRYGPKTFDAEGREVPGNRG